VWRAHGQKAATAKLQEIARLTKVKVFLTLHYCCGIGN